jgi:hypothetical protein
MNLRTLCLLSLLPFTPACGLDPGHTLDGGDAVDAGPPLDDGGLRITGPYSFTVGEAKTYFVHNGSVDFQTLLFTRDTLGCLSSLGAPNSTSPFVNLSIRWPDAGTYTLPGDGSLGSFNTEPQWALHGTYTFVSNDAVSGTRGSLDLTAEVDGGTVHVAGSFTTASCGWFCERNGTFEPCP